VFIEGLRDYDLTKVVYIPQGLVGVYQIRFFEIVLDDSNGPKGCGPLNAYHKHVIT